MYSIGEYWQRGSAIVGNRLFPGNKKLNRLMIYATDLCDSACKHCLIWAKRPVKHLPAADIVKLMESRCVTSNTNIGLEGGEFMLHPEAHDILQWFYDHHRNYDILSNCLKPDSLIAAVRKYKPQRLYISLDGNEETYLYMRGKAGYQHVLQVIKALHKEVTISVMFTLSPYNDFGDMEHVAAVCRQYGIDMRVGLYNNIPLFDTYDKAHETEIGEQKQTKPLQYKDVAQLKDKIEATKELKQAELTNDPHLPQHDASKIHRRFADFIPEGIKEFKENYEYLALYEGWRRKQVQLKCFSIIESLVVLPNGDVPLCQNLDLVLGNIHQQSLDEIFNGKEAQQKQQHYMHNCNQCWLAFHRKYDVALYRTFEQVFGKWATGKMLGYYQWREDGNASLKQVLK